MSSRTSIRAERDDLARKLIKDSKFRIEDDGTIWTRVLLSGHVSEDRWRRAGGKSRTISYDGTHLSEARIVYIKFIGEIPQGQFVFFKDRDSKNLKPDNLILIRPGGATIHDPRTASLNSLVSNYKYGAKKRGLSFNLNIAEFDLLISARCAYCGKPPQKEIKSECSDFVLKYNGIDRIHNSRGYTRGNSITCCWECNKFKRAYSVKDLKRLVASFYSFYFKS